MSRDERPFEFRHVLVFAPYTEIEGRPYSADYDTAEYRDDVRSWLEPLGVSWDWTPVTLRGLNSAIELAVAARADGGVVVFNLCDGTDKDGYPGVSVIEALERARLPYTGADARFYRVSSSKIEMKRRFEQAGARTAPWRVIADTELDLAVAGREIGYPLFIKPEVAGGSGGVTRSSLVRDHAKAVIQVERLRRKASAFNFEAGASILAERFLSGREFTVFVESENRPDGEARALPACERVFDLIPGQRFVVEDERVGFRFAALDAELDKEVKELALAAYRAVDGAGYARVDLRQDDDGRTFVLEVNANCGLSSDNPENGASVGAIVANCGGAMSELAARLLRQGWSRRRLDGPLSGLENYHSGRPPLLAQGD